MSETTTVTVENPDAMKTEDSNTTDPWGNAGAGDNADSTASDPWGGDSSSGGEDSSPWGGADAGGDTSDAWGGSGGADGSADWLNQVPQDTSVHFSWLHPFQDTLLPLSNWLDTGGKEVLKTLRPFFSATKAPIETALGSVDAVLQYTPSPLIIVIMTLLAWQLAGRRLAIGTFISLICIGVLGAWEEAMTTLSLVITSVLFCTIIGIPVGILMARKESANKILRPILDAMQTTPAFVYLVPIVMLFGIGNVPGVVVSIIFSVPPVIRLTNLGIRQVPADLVEAAQSFGVSSRQMLTRVQLPLAMPTIMAGVNQTLMLCLSMVVIASMISVPGLGLMVLRGIGRLDIGVAIVGGVGIVILAIILDRMTQALGQDARARGTRHWYHSGPAGVVYRLCHRKQNENQEHA